MWDDPGGSDDVPSTCCVHPVIAVEVFELTWPYSKPTGPAEFLPILLALTPNTSASANGDPLTSSGPTQKLPSTSTALGVAELLPFLNDLASRFSGETLADVVTPTLSLFFQEWFKLSPTPDVLGNDWRKYLGAVATLVQVKGIAALVS